MGFFLARWPPANSEERDLEFLQKIASFPSRVGGIPFSEARGGSHLVEPTVFPIPHLPSLTLLAHKCQGLGKGNVKAWLSAPLDVLEALPVLLCGPEMTPAVVCRVGSPLWPLGTLQLG